MEFQKNDSRADELKDSSLSRDEQMRFEIEERIRMNDEQKLSPAEIEQRNNNLKEKYKDNPALLQELNKLEKGKLSEADAEEAGKDAFSSQQDFQESLSQLREESSIFYSLGNFTEKNPTIIDAKALALNLDESSEYAVSTGFKNLDEKLSGGFTSGVYFLGAMPGLGKTSFLSNLWDNQAKAGHAVLVFSLEMPRTTLIKRSISRITLELEDREPSRYKAVPYKSMIISNLRSNLKPREKETIDEAFKIYCNDIAPNVMIIDRPISESGETKEPKEHISYNKKTRETETSTTLDPVNGGRFTPIYLERMVKALDKMLLENPMPKDKRPIVYIDYLQIIRPDNDRNATDKQIVDELCAELRKLALLYRIPIICVSSTNREAYKDLSAEIDITSFKESGTIEYDAEGILGMQLEGIYQESKVGTGTNAHMEKRRVVDTYNELHLKGKGNYQDYAERHIELKILKSRLSDMESCVAFNFYPAFCSFKAKESERERARKA